MDELEQCPFCGNKARIIFDKERVLIECIECMACVWEYCTDDARQAWNTRAQDKLLDDMAEILKVSKCPNCDGGGAIGHEVENYMYSDSGEPIPNHYTEWEQCQWCYEKEDLLTRYRALKGE